MENENREQLIDYEDENAFGPHIKEVNEYGHMRKHYFFTLSYKEQDVSRNKIFIQWKKDMKKINDLVIHCQNVVHIFQMQLILIVDVINVGFFSALDAIKMVVIAKIALNGGKLLFHFLVSKNMEMQIF